MFSAALNISLILGTPSVTFMLATPAKWKVFKVIWVQGSPRDWAVIAPTPSPGYIYVLQSLFSRVFTTPILSFYVIFY